MVDTNVQWVERALARELTEPQKRCVDVICTMGRAYNLDRLLAGENLDDRWNFTPNDSLEVRYKGELASYDADYLTKLVLAAHHKGVRVTVNAMSNMSMLVRAQPWREQESMFKGHRSLKWLSDMAHSLSSEDPEAVNSKSWRLNIVAIPEPGGLIKLIANDSIFWVEKRIGKAQWEDKPVRKALIRNIAMNIRSYHVDDCEGYDLADETTGKKESYDGKL